MKRQTLLFIASVACASLGAGCYGPPTEPSPSVPTQPEPSSTVESQAPPQSSSTPTTSVTPSSAPLAFPGILPASEVENKVIHLKTTKGDIVFELLPKEGPNAASNFVYLVKRKFYDGLTFHRVIEGFMAQGGDPLGTGTGGPGYRFADDPVHLPYNKGIVAMANAGPDTNGSQFFIMKADYPLGPDYSIFGRVVSGQDVVENLRVGDKMLTVTVDSK